MARIYNRQDSADSVSSEILMNDRKEEYYIYRESLETRLIVFVAIVFILLLVLI